MRVATGSGSTGRSSGGTDEASNSAADGASLAQAARADGADRLQTNLENRAQLLDERARGVSHPRPKGSMVVTEVGTVRRKGRRTRVPRRVWVSDRAGEATREPTAAEREQMEKMQRQAEEAMRGVVKEMGKQVGRAVARAAKDAAVNAASNAFKGLGSGLRGLFGGGEGGGGEKPKVADNNPLRGSRRKK